MNGLVYKSTGNWYNVHTDSRKVYKCNIKGKFRSLGIKSTNPVAVGDRVVFEITDEAEEKIICNGGKGGRGNWHFKSPTNQTPRYSQPGIPLEEIF